MVPLTAQPCGSLSFFCLFRGEDSAQGLRTAANCHPAARMHSAGATVYHVQFKAITDNDSETINIIATTCHGHRQRHYPPPPRNPSHACHLVVVVAVVLVSSSSHPHHGRHRHRYHLHHHHNHTHHIHHRHPPPPTHHHHHHHEWSFS